MKVVWSISGQIVEKGVVFKTLASLQVCEWPCLALSLLWNLYSRLTTTKRVFNSQPKVGKCFILRINAVFRVAWWFNAPTKGVPFSKLAVIFRKQAILPCSVAFFHLGTPYFKVIVSVPFYVECQLVATKNKRLFPNAAQPPDSSYCDKIIHKSELLMSQNQWLRSGFLHKFEYKYSEFFRTLSRT